MKCESCRKHEATVAFTQIADDAKKTIHLCARCAAARSGTVAGGKPAEPVGEQAETAKTGAATAAAPRVGARCPECGMTYEEFRKIGRLGCHACYAAFAPQLELLLRRVHGARRHVGKGLIAPRPAVFAEQELAELKLQLRAAVAAEAYEQAAQLRDRIAQLEREVGSGEQ
jgi:protein arginine kinase activator